MYVTALQYKELVVSLITVAVSQCDTDAFCFDRVEYGVQSVRPSAGQHHIPQQIPERR